MVKLPFHFAVLVPIEMGLPIGRLEGSQPDVGTLPDVSVHGIGFLDCSIYHIPLLSGVLLWPKCTILSPIEMISKP